MKQNKRRMSTVFLIIGMAFLVIGLSTNNTIFTWISIVFIIISLITGGRWLRPRKR